MGEVYQAYDARLRRTVAIKVLPPHLATPERLERFEQEARAASTLNHPNILTVHDEQALERARATAARSPRNLEARFHLSDVAYLADGQELESVLASLVEQSPTNRLWSGESVRLRSVNADRKSDSSAD